jgi:outer membrane receptor protein involved in Fe transport
MSGVMDISVDAPSEPVTTTVALSTINARVHSAGSFDGDLGSWMVSARAWYPDALLNLASGTADDLLTDFYDLFAKIEHTVSERSTLSADLLLAYDDLGYRTVDEGTIEGVKARYGSYHLWFNLRTAWTERLYSRIVLSGGRLERDRVGDMVDVEEGTLEVGDDRYFDFIDLRQDWTLDLTADNLLKWGIDLSFQEARYDYVRTEHDPFEDGEPVMNGSETIVYLEPESWSIGAYLADRFRPVDPLVLELGLRWDSQTWIDDHQLSPRANLMYNVGPSTALRVAWGRFHQSQRLNELQVEDGATEFYTAQSSEHWLVSVDHRFASGLRMRVEAYLKDLSNLRPRYENLFSPIDLFPEALPDRILIEPRNGRSRGVEVILKQDVGGRLSWWFSYALASAEDEIDGNWQPRSWDQRHAATFGLNLSLPRRWNLNFGGTWHSGWPTTEVTAELVVGPEGEIEVEPILGPRNGERYASYHRVDMRATKHIPTRHGDLTRVIEILNLFNARNICCTDEFEYEVEDEGLVTVMPVYQHWAPIIPSVGVRYRF